METGGEVHAPASTLLDTSGLKATQDDCRGGGGRGPEASKGEGDGVPSVSGRARWLKGAPDSPTSTSSNDDGGDGDSDSCFANVSKLGVDGGCEVDVGGSACGNVVAGGVGSACVGNLSRSSATGAGAGAGADAGVDAGGGGTDGDDGMAWLETGPGGGNGGGSGNSGHSKASSKKKKKNKAKGKGGKPKKACPGKGTPSSNELPAVEGGATAAAAAAAAAAADDGGGAGAGADADASSSSTASSSKAVAKRSRSNKQRKALNVTFGCVRLLEFTRDVGGCGVPGDGTWGLALGLPFRETSVEVDGYEASKTEVSMIFLIDLLTHRTDR